MGTETGRNTGEPLPGAIDANPSGLAVSPARAGLGRDPLAGARILIVEDEMMVAAMLEDVLREFGCEIVGPVSRVDDALALLQTAPVDAAVLDVNLAGEPVFPVADALAARGVPFVFSTAYGAAGVTADHAGHDVLQKPWHIRSLQRALQDGLQGRR